MHLAEYIEREQIPLEAMAVEVGCSLQTMRHFVYGTKLPSKDKAYRIQQLTQGEVQISDWFSRASPHGGRPPSLRTIYQIYRATNGRIGLEQFVGNRAA